MGTELALSHSGLDRIRDLLFQALKHVADIDLTQFKRSTARDLLWNEVTSLQRLRNQVVHRAHVAHATDAEVAIEVASAVLNDVFPKVVKAVGLHVHEAGRVCNDWTCKLEGTIGRELLAKFRSIRAG